MTRRYEPTPIPIRLERDALIASVVDSSPIGGILTDGELQLIHANPEALELLGLTGAPGALPRLIANSRVTRPDTVVSFLNAALEGGPAHSLHAAESVDGRMRAIVIEAKRCHQVNTRWLWWIRDVTDTSRLQQFQLLAEIGRSPGTTRPTLDLAERLVDAIISLLGADIAVLTMGDERGLRPLAFRGLLLEDGFVLDPAERTYVGKAMRSGRAVIGDGSEWDSAEEEMTGTHYIVPLTSAGQVLGTLHISSLGDSTSAAARQTFDLDFLEALSAYAGSALANARLLEELRAEELKLKTVLDTIPHGILLFTGSGEVLAANAAMSRLTSMAWTNLNTDSRPYRILDLDGNPIRRMDWPFFRITRTSTPIVGETLIMDFGDVQRFAMVSVIPLPLANDDATPTYLATVQDITEETERRRERDAFVQIASHELRSPLTPLTGFLQMLRKQSENGEQLDIDLLHRAEGQVGRLARLIDSMLDMSRLERGISLDREAVDLRQVVGRVADLWNADPRGVTVSVAAPPGTVLASVDVDRMEQILTNLLENAVKQSPNGARIDVAVESDTARCIIRVRDHGPGIPPEELPRVFDRFFSGRGSRGGLGLGLHITRQLVQAHGGEIRVSSTPGRGATFEIVLPAAVH